MIKKVFTEKPDLPNEFSIEIGARIHEARVESDLTQEQLATRIYKRRASISDMENGKMYPDAFTLALIGNRLNKPVEYFIPEQYRLAQPHEEGELSPQERELINQFRRLPNFDYRKRAIALVKAAADLL